MKMRFNKQELFALASQTTPGFDREGVLIVKEKQDGFFRRSDGSVPRWFRLRGNLLFYLRNTEPLSEPIGFIVLGHHKVEVQTHDENGYFTFQLVWSNGVCYKMATYTESEREAWIKAINTASYEDVKAKMSMLIQKINRAQPTIDISMWRAQRGIVLDMNEIPLCELALSCDNLLCDPHGRPPSAKVVVIVKYSKGISVKYGSTEVVQSCSNPSFCKTILFRACDGLTGDSVVRLIAYDVKEPVSDTMVPMGSATLSLSTIQEAQRLRIALINYDNRTVGFITINGWSLEPSFIGTSPSHSNDRNSVDIPQKLLCHRRSQSLPPRLGLKLKFPSVGNLLKQNFVNSHQVTYRFHSGLGGDITVYEIMAESRLCFPIPVQLLNIFIQREKELLRDLLSLGDMNSKWKPKQLELINSHISLLKHYSHAKKSLIIASEDQYFKPSMKKEEPSLDFAPVNLHLQRMWVHNDTLNKTSFHDIITTGAFTAHAQKAEKSGGLIRLVQQVKDINNSTAVLNSMSATKIQTEYDSILAVRRLRDQVVEMAQKAVAKPNKEQYDVTNTTSAMINKTKEMLSLWDPSVVEEALSFVTWNKSSKSSDSSGIDDQTKGTLSIKHLKEQLFANESSFDMDTLGTASASSSLDTSPVVDTPGLSASVPNISCRTISSASSFFDLQSCTDLEFHNDYFTSEQSLDFNEKCFSLRLGKGKLNDTLCLSFDHSVNRKPKYTLDLRSYFRGTSLDQVNNRHSSNDEEWTKCKTNGTRRDTYSLVDIEGSRLPEVHCSMAASIDKSLDDLVQSIRDLAHEETGEEALPRKLSTVKAKRDQFVYATEAAVGKLQQAHAVARLRYEATQWTRANAALQIRRDICFTQALTALTTGLLCWLCSVPHEVIVKLLSSGLGPLCGFEGLLSLYGGEKAKWGDMVVAVEDLHTVMFVLTKANYCANSIPQVRGSRGAITVHIPISDSLYVKLESKQCLSLSVTAVFFNMGVDERAGHAEAAGETAPQVHSNCDNYDRLHNYYLKYRRIFSDDLHPLTRASSRTKPLEEVIENLRISVHKKVPRNYEVLQLAALATRLMNGIRFTSCKSAKDRTGMSTTLEQCSILASEYHLAENEISKVLDILRSEGCRRENTLKNIGVRKYAFTKRQVAALPKLYRPPPGTFGACKT